MIDMGWLNIGMSLTEPGLLHYWATGSQEILTSFTET